MTSVNEATGSAWWAARRFRYNIALAVAGVVAFITYVIVLGSRCADTPGVEVTLFTTLFQGIGYLLAMGLANLFYQLGPRLERFVESSSLPVYRAWAFRAGLAFSVALPFAIPIMILVAGCGRGDT
jgi:magnesium-transporting ATPase (P-type)